MRYSAVKVKIIQRGETLKEFAKRIGFGRQYWYFCKTLDGTRHSRAIQEAIAQELGESASELFGETFWEHFSGERRAS